MYTVQCKLMTSSGIINFLNLQASHSQINPSGIVAIGPDIDFNLPHDRATRFSQ